MSLRISVLFIPLLAAACGFSPMYGAKTAEPGAKQVAGVAIDSEVVGRPGQLFKADLEDKLNPGGSVPAQPEYRLKVTLTSSAGAIGVARDGTISRYNVYLDSTYKLYDARGKELTQGSLRHVGSYNNLANRYFSTYVSEQDAIKRGITELAELYKQRLSPYLSQKINN